MTKLSTATPPVSPLISIVLPAYKSAPYIEQTVGSILKQTYPHWELLVVDDGSPDDTASIVAAMPDPRIKLIRQANAGISGARNTGIARAKGAFIAFMDHDDLWHPQKLAVQLACLMDLATQASICYGAFQNWDGSDPSGFLAADLDPRKIDESLSGHIYHRLLATNWVLLSTALFKREVFDEIGLFDRELPPADDWDLVLRASRRFRFLKLQDPVALYRVHAQQTSRKTPGRDIQGCVRESFIHRYGLSGPDGLAMSARDLAWRRVYSKMSYISTLWSNGAFALALAESARLWRSHPADSRSWRAVAQSLLKWALSKFRSPAGGPASTGRGGL